MLLQNNDCFLLCPQECSYTLLGTVMLIVIILVIMGKIQADNTLCDASRNLKSAPHVSKLTLLLIPFPTPFLTPMLLPPPGTLFFSV